MAKIFGTDGVRGVAGTELTEELAYKLGQAAVQLLGKKMVIGRDTRKSGPMLESALAAGIAAAGGEAVLAGIIPTPAVALLTRQLNAAGGVVISASHNPPEYNGIKFFDDKGFKLTTMLEDEFETFILSGERIDADEPGVTVPMEDALERYVAHAVDTVLRQGTDLQGLRVAVDCGHGASYATTPEALRRLGADVIVINTDFSGDDINVNCGSTHLEPIKALVAKTDADVGISHDGDADRVIAIDSHCREVDGDFIEAICAKDLKERGKLANNTVVSTVMCNLGFQNSMKNLDIDVILTQVGDSQVLEAMLEGGYILGGEQSGHTIFLELNSTGDGLVTALQLLSVMKRSKKTLTDLTQVMTKYPQALINVKVVNKAGLKDSMAISTAVEEAQVRLQESGRILVRASGTESLVRVMVEASDEVVANEVAQKLAEIVKTELG
ncbi:MAG: phosphoglucosamine mutase [Coriobacteriaceae bacterium]|nr:phosphoglucosamine mutase [Coriobacteriaceae bacterium]